MGRQRGLLILILVMVLASIYIIVDERHFPTLLGLDLRGGSQITIQVKPTAEIKNITSEQLGDVQRVIEGRINGLGVSEPLVQTAGENQILVQLPGVSDPEQAERVLGGTAQLDFRAQKPGTEQQLPIEYQIRRELLAKQKELRKSNDEKAIAENQAALKRSNDAIAALFDSPALGGRNLQNAQPESSPGSSAFSVALRFDQEGGDKFAQLTKSLAGTGRSLGIFLDNGLISFPSVGAEFAQTGITGGGAVITGNFTAQEATDLAVQLRGGSLPLPVEVVENRTVGATLGRDSIQSSIYAGLGGLLFVLGFMVVYYRLPGVISAISLIIYALLTYAGFKLLGVTLTLPGIAGFILSIGMAVDANILIFERTREELQSGKTLYRSVESGFFRAFSSILDSNVTTAIACLALIFLGSGLVRGFGVTLLLGVAISMFTAVTCSRTLLLYALTFAGLRKPEWYSPNVPKANQSISETAS
ncbi:protein translocase subunit SecD [Leptolyngbya boryana CZ1]|uniref:Protein translocase subunit SecD n=1 Tax=Leptolyngbya boryana CZ1 TaxID=3060204 RepID=A0AA97ANZ8_LEPBY|nr:protein translocase subunit SecD [Leptolyngbya boryana]WNZ46268.1 protein translocase subunit SecD [Leptolyngbya boryana CZ1]